MPADAEDWAGAGGSIKRVVRIFFTYSIKIISLLLAVSIISFTLVSVSPIDPVQQYILSSVPTFWLGLVFLLIFAVGLKWFPIGFSGSIGVLSRDVTIWQKLHHLILPAFTLSLMSFSNIALHTRQKLVDVLNSEYVLFAKARGEGKWTILRRHGFRNILFPALTLQFASFAELFGGSVMAENVFSYPGLGSAASAAGLRSDVPLLLAVIYLLGICTPEEAAAASFLNAKKPPSWEHPFGTDALGRDLLMRTLKGLSVSITVGMAASVISAVIAVLVGIAAAAGQGRLSCAAYLSASGKSHQSPLETAQGAGGKRHAS